MAGRFNGKSKVWVFIVAHAPTEVSDDDVKDRFWDLLGDVLHTVVRDRNDSVCLLADANARVGSRESSCFGVCDAEVENDNGERFRRCLT